MSLVRLIIKCCPRNIYEVSNHQRSGKRLHNNLKITWNMPHIIGSIDRNMFELNIQKTLETYTTTTRDFLALFQLCATLITALRCSTLVNMTVITIAASLFTATWEDIFKITRISRNQSVEGCDFDPLRYFLVGDKTFPLKT